MWTGISRVDLMYCSYILPKSFAFQKLDGKLRQKADVYGPNLKKKLLFLKYGAQRWMRY